MLPKVINLAEKLSQFSEQWSPRIVAQLNDYQFKLAKVEGNYVWHSHKETDEVFLVIRGELNIDFREGEITLQSGEMCVIPRGMEHKPQASTECHILLVEPEGIQTTREEGAASVAEDSWI